MSMTSSNFFEDWFWDAPGRVKLVYADDEIVFVPLEDFFHSFDRIVSASKEEVIRDFAIEV